ncbi:DMT family transporter [Allohahella marinimesophila]|uniref:DMT family transporter n=1 Tax=Allohahella marinimesophila TaxID=1054972 RepID=A0ABP7NII6_9GAMM
MQTIQAQPLKADLLLVIVTLLAAAGWIFSRETLQGMPPLLFIGIRFLGAAVLLALLSRNHMMTTTKSQWQAGLPSAICFSLALVVWIHALQRTEHVGVGAFITSLAIVLVPVAGWLIYRELPQRAQWYSLPVSAAGLVFLATDDLTQPDPGHLLFAVAAVLFAIHFTLTGRAVRLLPALPLTITQLAMVGLVTLVISALVESWPGSISPVIWGWLLASLVLATAMRFYLQTHAQALSSANHAAVILTLEPVFTALLAAFWLGETLNTAQLTGCLLIFGAMLIARWPVIKALFSKRKDAS